MLMRKLPLRAALVDGLKGFPEAIAAVFPKTTIQTCIVHLIRNSLAYASWKDRKASPRRCGRSIARRARRPRRGLWRPSRAAPGGRNTRRSCRSWRRAWEQVIPFYAFPPEVRRIIYTTNAIESLHMQLRKIIKTRGHFPPTRRPRS